MRRLLKHAGSVLRCGGLTQESYDAVRPMIDADNLGRLRFYTRFATVFFIVLTLLYIRFYQEAYANKVWVIGGYAVMAAVMAILALMSHDEKAILQSDGAAVVLRYIFCGAVYALTFFMAFIHPQDAATSFIVALVVIPMLFVEKPIRQLVMTLTVSVIYIVLVFGFKEKWLAYLDLWYVITFGFLSIVLMCGTARMRFYTYEQELRVKILGETDVLTGTMNRNKFESMAPVHAANPSAYIAYVYGDVNGLHELNNSKGHLAGDVMLKTVAAAMIAAFGAANVYRMGGDEFVAFVPGKTEEQIAKIVADIEENLARQGYHVSFGIAQTVRDGAALFDVNTLLLAAEKRMYAAKREYYKDAAHDRRRRDR